MVWAQVAGAALQAATAVATAPPPASNAQAGSRGNSNDASGFVVNFSGSQNADTRAGNKSADDGGGGGGMPGVGTLAAIAAGVLVLVLLLRRKK